MPAKHQNRTEKREERIEKKREKGEARSRGLSVEELRKKKASERAEQRREELSSRLDDKAMAFQLPEQMGVNVKSVLVNGAERFYLDLDNFLFNAFVNGGVDQNDIPNRSENLKKWIMRYTGSKSLLLGPDAAISLEGGKVKVSGLLTDDRELVEDVWAEKLLAMDMDAAQGPRTQGMGQETGAEATIKGSGENISVENGVLEPYDPSKDGFTQRPDGTWVSTGANNANAGRRTVEPPIF